MQKVTLDDAQQVPRSVLRRELRRVRRGRTGRRRPPSRRPRRSCSAAGTRRRRTSRSSRRSRRSAPINEKIETPDKANAQFLAGVRVPARRRTIPTIRRCVLASYMFGGPITSRISDRIRNREGLSYGANARHRGARGRRLGDAVRHRQPESGERAEGRGQLHGRAAKTLKDGFTAAEVAKAKKAYLDSRMVARSTDGALLGLLASHEQLDRTDEVGRAAGAEDPGADRGAGQRGVPQARRSRGTVDRQSGRFEGGWGIPVE